MSAHDDDARRLVELYAERIRLTAELAAMERKTGADVDRVMAAGDELDAACEAFRRRHYPRRTRVISAGYAVFVCSATMRRVEQIYDGSAEFAPVLNAAR